MISAFPPGLTRGYPGRPAWLVSGIIFISVPNRIFTLILTTCLAPFDLPNPQKIDLKRKNRLFQNFRMSVSPTRELNFRGSGVKTLPWCPPGPSKSQSNFSSNLWMFFHTKMTPNLEAHRGNHCALKAPRFHFGPPLVVLGRPKRRQSASRGSPGRFLTGFDFMIIWSLLHLFFFDCLAVFSDRFTCFLRCSIQLFDFKKSWIHSEIK